MKRLACIILILTILISGLAFVRISVHATTVSGNITTNTEWTINDSPIVLNSTVRVYPNATLTIDPGVTVSFAAYSSMYISGILTAIGRPDSLITFTCPDSQTIGASIFFDSVKPRLERRHRFRLHHSIRQFQQSLHLCQLFIENR